MFYLQEKYPCGYERTIKSTWASIFALTIKTDDNGCPLHGKKCS